MSSKPLVFAAGSPDPSFSSVWRSVRTRGALVVLVAVLSAGCSDTPNELSGQDSGFQQHQQQAAENEKRYFRDGVIVFGEYREAVLGTVACVRKRGVNMAAELASDGFFQYVAVGDGTDAALDACRQLWSREVELAYQETHRR